MHVRLTADTDLLRAYGSASAGHADDLQAVAVGDVKAISQVDGHHLGIHQVEAVIAAADQPERERQLGRR